MERRASRGRSPLATTRPSLECVQVDLLRAAQEVIEEHPAPLQSLRVLADDDVLQVVGFIQAWQGQEEVGFGHYQVQIDFAAAVQFGSAAKRSVPEDIALEPQLLDDPRRCDALQAPPSLTAWATVSWCSGTRVDEATRKLRAWESRG